MNPASSSVDLLPLGALLRPWHWRLRRTLIVDANPATTFRAARAVTVGELPSAAGKRKDSGDVAVLDDLVDQGFVRLETTTSRVVLGRVGQFWRTGGNGWAAADLQAFLDFDEPGYAKAVIGLGVAPVVGGTLIVIETRLVATDETTYQEFNRHWLVEPWTNSHTQADLLGALQHRLA